MNFVRRFFERFRKHKPLDLANNADQLFFYVEGLLDTECETIEVEYIRNGVTLTEVKIRIDRHLTPRDEHFDKLIDAWMENEPFKVGLQFGGSGRIMKTQGIISDMKIVGSTESSRMVYTLRCEAKPFE